MPPRTGCDVEVARDAAFADVWPAARSRPSPPRPLGAVEVSGLDPDAWFHYLFTVDGYTSPGVAPAHPPADAARRCGSGAASCQHWCSGY